MPNANRIANSTTKCKAIKDDDCWTCPKCGSNETWFDRSIAYCDGVEEGPTTRCAGCGRDVDELISEIKED